MLEKFTNSLDKNKRAQSKRSRADELRDAGKFSEAAAAYGDYLADVPSDFDIWVQRGNCLKDSGAHEAASSAYGTAITLNPNNADVHLQLGHLMKLRGMTSAAVESYARALELNPRLSHARLELTELGASVDLPLPSSDSQNYIDLSDVFFYIRHHSTLSGIQRVQVGIAEALINANVIGDDYAFVTAAPGGGYLTVDQRLVQTLLRTLATAKVELENLRVISERAATEGDLVELGRGDTIIILGAFWVMENIVEQIVSLKRKGARVALLVHDIIPITHPEFCETALTDTFNMYVNAVMHVVDLVLFISEASQRAVERLLLERKIPQPSMRVLRNAHLTWKKRSGRPALVSDEVGDLLDKSYVMYVSTIEVRKNHTLLFRIWKRLLEDVGPEMTPTLVFVGRPGWRVRDLMDQIASTKNLSGKLVILHDISDVELQRLYESSLFTTFPSFVEGWGLPVGESLVFGRPCIASNTSSIPEVAGDLVDYIDPHNLDSSYNVFLRTIQDNDYRESKVQRIAREFRPRTWMTVAEELRQIISDELPKSTSRSPYDANEIERNATGTPVLASGVFHRTGHRDDRHAFVNTGLGPLAHLLFDVNWYPVENFGRWLKNRRGQIDFKTDASPVGDYVVYLELCAVSWYANNPIVLTVNGQKHEISDMIPDRPLRVKLRVSANDGIIRIGLRVTGVLAKGPDPRKDLSVGIAAIGYARADDFIARQDIVESFTLSSPRQIL